MIVGLVGAFMTAAYMTRATYLTFFGEPRGASAGNSSHESHDAHGSHDAHDTHNDHVSHDAHASHGPHESGLLITAPLMILSVLALGSGFLNATPFGESWERMKLWVEPRAVEVVDATPGGPGESLIVSVPSAEEGKSKSVCGTATPEKGVCYAPKLEHAKFKWSKAMLSMVIVFIGMALSWILSVLLFTKRDARLVGLTQRVKILGVGHRFLVNKYYLDDLYEKVIVRGVAYPISSAAYWFNQNVLDGILHSISHLTRKLSGWVYKNIDQRVVDGTVNNSATFTKSVGTAAQPTQSGKVSQYGALLFSAAAVAALVLVIINT
jgi:NADH-quinone oxidoreductase subunit L